MTATHAAAPAPTSASNFTLTWNLITIPAKVYTGADRGSRFSRSMFTPDGNPIGSQNYDKVTGETYAGEIIKKAKASSGELVALTDDEIDAVQADDKINPGVLEIERFIPLEAIGTAYTVEKVDQIRTAPMQAGKHKVPNAAADKAFGLLLSAMTERGVAALVRVPRRGAYSYAAITPAGDFVYLLFAEQVRQQLPLPAAAHSDQEMTLGLALIDQTGVGTPVLSDVVTGKLQAYVDSRATGETPIATPAPAAVEQQAPVDLLAILTASVQTIPARKGKSKKAAAA